MDGGRGWDPALVSRAFSEWNWGGKRAAGKNGEILMEDKRDSMNCHLSPSLAWLQGPRWIVCLGLEG